MNIDETHLLEFENLLNPAFPEKSGIVPDILGYGEISTTFSMPSIPGVAFKRMPPFESSRQVAVYKTAVRRYCDALEKVCGVHVAEVAFFDFLNQRKENILYVAQPRLPETSIGHNVLKLAAPEDLEKMLNAVMGPLIRLFKYNCENSEHESVGLDGQLSNWSFGLSDIESVPVYFDVTTPMIRVDGKEQLDTDIFLKSCPSFLIWLVRWQFLDEVLDRYHDVRMIIIDIVANFFKEGREDLIDDALSLINRYLDKENLTPQIPVLGKKEVEGYYKNDAFIWSLFLTLRRFDRFLKTKLFRQRYNFILPGRIRR